MISYLMRRIAGRVIRRITGEDREPVGMVSDREFELAGYALTFAAGFFACMVGAMVIYTFYLRSPC